jgi:hypothetical protein
MQRGIRWSCRGRVSELLERNETSSLGGSDLDLVAIPLLIRCYSPSRTAVGASAVVVCEECAEDERNGGRPDLRPLCCPVVNSRQWPLFAHRTIVHRHAICPDIDSP